MSETDNNKNNNKNGDDKEYSEDPNSFRAKCNKIILLVYGYTKSTLNIRYIPVDIIEIIIRYYPTEYSILSIGRNLFGEFGLNSETENNNKYVTLIKLSSLCYNHREIYCGFFTFTVRTENNEFYCCGNNCDGQLGVNINEYNINQFAKIPSDSYLYDSPIKLFSDGPFSWHRIFVTENNKFYGFGRNKNSTLGADEYPEKNYKPIPLFNVTQLFTNYLKYEIRSIQCGASHTLFLCVNGKLFSVGENDHGQCGIIVTNHHLHLDISSSSSSIIQPTEIKNIPFIIDIAVGEYFSLCRSQNNDLWVFGSNNNYQLGIDNVKKLNESELSDDDDDDITDLEDDEDNVDILQPTLNRYFSDRNILIETIRCGESHSLVIDMNGYVYCCGQNTHGESLGKYVLSEERKYNPVCFESVIDDYNVLIEDGSCGNTHTMLLTKDSNQIYGFGANDHGQVAVGCKETKIHKPYLLRKSQIGIDENNHIERVIAGCYTTLIVCNKL